MANYNRVMIICRLTREPEAIANGKGAKMGVAVNNSKLNQQTGQWENDPVFIDCEIWNRGDNGQQANRVLETLHKGSQVFIEGRLRMDSWNDKETGAKRTAIKIIVDNFQYLDPKPEGQATNGGQSRPQQTRQPARQPQADPWASYDGGSGENDGSIPF